MKNVQNLWIWVINAFLIGFVVSCGESSKELRNYEREISIYIYHLNKNSENLVAVKEDSPVGSFLKNVHAFEKQALGERDPLVMVSPSVTGPYILLAKIPDTAEGEGIVYFAAEEDRSLSSHLKDVEKFDEFQSWFRELDLPFRKSEIPMSDRILQISRGSEN
jgi:hypothetical protein